MRECDSIKRFYQPAYLREGRYVGLGTTLELPTTRNSIPLYRDDLKTNLVVSR